MFTVRHHAAFAAFARNCPSRPNNLVHAIQGSNKAKRGFFFKPPAAHLDVGELALDHAQWVLDLGTDRGLDALDLVGEAVYGLGLVKRPALARSHRDVPGYFFRGIRELGCTLVASIGEDVLFISMQQPPASD
jgi:hypothetical protein